LIFWHATSGHVVHALIGGSVWERIADHARDGVAFFLECAMRNWVLAAIAAVLVAQGGGDVTLGALCPTAARLIAQELENPERRERSTPPGHWCQRAAPRMDQQAHACKCHQHNCTDPDPNHVSAHTDGECKNFCHQQACKCERQDCP